MYTFICVCVGVYVYTHALLTSICIYAYTHALRIHCIRVYARDSVYTHALLTSFSCRVLGTCTHGAKDSVCRRGVEEEEEEEEL